MEVNLLQTLGRSLQLSASAFYSRFSNLIQPYGPDGIVNGRYLGWPVDYIDFTINEGRATGYGGTMGAAYVRTFSPSRRLEAHGSVALTDGRVWPHENLDHQSVPVGVMAPVQFRFGADIDWDDWRIAPRLSVVGAQRVLATPMESGSLERMTLPGDATVDVNLRRHLFKTLDAFLTVENLLDRRYVNVNPYAFTNTQEVTGAPQNPRRFTVGVDVRIR